MPGVLFCLALGSWEVRKLGRPGRESSFGGRKIIAKATKSPSIPEKASVGYNSTKRNFIDLDRTNLIGIVGKSSNPSALLRLSNGKIVKLKVGQWFEGWRVFAIDRDKIHVENGFKQEILRMPG